MKTSKNTKIDKVGLLILGHYLKNPQAKLNIQKIATQAGVSRPWIYKNFGSSQKEIILTTIDSLSGQVVSSNIPEKTDLTTAEWAKQFMIGLNNFLMDIEKYPDVFRFYMLSKLYANEFAERFQFHEDRFLTKRAVPLIRKTFNYSPDESRSMAELIHSLRIGIALQWLNVENKTSLGRTKILKTIKLRLLDHIQNPKA